MFKFYPSNRMEALVLQLEGLLSSPSKNALSEDVIVVQNQGMHHWLSLELASRRSVIMNTRFPLPANFFWEIIRNVLKDDKVPEVSLYNRDILIWSIYLALADSAFTNNPHCKEPFSYWFDESLNRGDDLKRYQLAREQADLFEQYLIYRPEWISQWEVDPGHEWQAILWRFVSQQLGPHPLHHIERAVKQLPKQRAALPKRVIIFGLNALPPLWMDFLKEVSRFTDLHFFMLNPSDEFWGDIQSEKSYVRERSKWLSSGLSLSSLIEECSNPLLANLGQQGQECLNLVCERTDMEYSHFEQPGRDTLLHCVQDDILRLENASQQPLQLDDESINVVSCHSALREIQSLHDWLLMQLRLDPTLTPKDILVMSPQVENYAPYVDSVFRRGRYQYDQNNVRLPCSIADRKLNDAEPLIQAFLELLTLPDSRFQVSLIISYLRLGAVQKKYDLEEGDIEQTVNWLSSAAIHWGLNPKHVSERTGYCEVKTNHTWEQGLSRLLIGYALGDEESIYSDINDNEYLALPDVSGDSAEKLGKLFYLIENLSNYATELTLVRTPRQWHRYLLHVIDGLFQSDESEVAGLQTIIRSVDTLVENTAFANFDSQIPLAVVAAYLTNCFDQPQQGQSFMTGQVTFCSMIPMRSVPFKVIAILGLNDGEFPRQRQPLGFDLLATSPAKLGDRSRRGDDRYLFLEALISAREKLYLSYQGNSIKNNQAREPSLVIKELTNYLAEGYGWNAKDKVRRYPMQPFSLENYQKPLYSFDGSWLSLATPKVDNHQTGEVRFPAESSTQILTLETLVSFFDHPSRAFARDRMKLNFDALLNDIPEDAEPFDSNSLQRYVLQLELIMGQIKGLSSAEIIHKETLRGKLPNTPLMENELTEWQSQADRFFNTLSEDLTGEVKEFEVTLSIGEQQLTAILPVCGDALVFWRPANPKGKDFLRMWLHHLVAMLVSGRSGIPVITQTIGFYRDTKKDQFKKVVLGTIEEPEAELEKWIVERRSGLETPLFVNADLAKSVCAKLRQGKAFTVADFNAIWRDDFNKRGLSFDPYVQWFWDTPPEWPGPYIASIQQLYAPMFDTFKEVEHA